MPAERSFYYLKIDYTKLTEQKQSLLTVLDLISEEGLKDDLTGILHLIDSIQDTAVDCGIDENIVFPNHEEE